MFLAHPTPAKTKADASKIPWVVLDAIAHLLLLENTANIRTLAIPEAKNVRMAAPAQW